jgi:hypothetical protein
MVEAAQLGPLARLAGTWEGDEGLDIAYSHARDAVIETHYRERTTFSPFGPVENGQQVLFGLDYRTAAWRPGEEIPFHTEVGYWLWDAASGEVMRCFIVPRGSTVLAIGNTTADATSFAMQAQVGSETDGILSNTYLAKHARTTIYEVTVTVEGDTYSYDECTTVEHARISDVLKHTDHNVLHRVSD